MNADPHGYLYQIIVLLVAAILAVSLLQRLRAGPVLGYVAAGVAVGPYGFGLIRQPEHAQHIAEFGVVFLLFTIGLELPLRRLEGIWHYIFGLGLAQVALTSLAVGLAAYALGATPEAALVIGGALAFSSTATVLQLLKERGELVTRFGRVSLAVLLFQDLAVVPLLALLPLLRQEGTALAAALGLALVKAAAALALMLLFGRLVLRPAYAGIAKLRTPEVFAAMNLLVVLGTSWATAEAGMSMALGAFLAGLLLAETEFRHQIEADIRPFRGLFLGLFFVTVGMLIDLRLVASNPAVLAGAALSLMLAKALILTGLGLAAGLGRAVAARVGLTLAQGGEFAFVALGLAGVLGLLSGEAGSLLAAVVALTMALTPLLAALGRRLATALEPAPAPETASLSGDAGDLANHIIIAGYGRIGEIVGRLLAARRIPFVAIDQDMRCVEAGRKHGAPVYFGDASQPEVLHAVGVARAAGAVITFDEPEPAQRIVAELRRSHPGLAIVARSRDAAHGQILQEAGASTIVLEALEPGLQIAAAALRLAGASSAEVDHALGEARSNASAKTA